MEMWRQVILILDGNSDFDEIGVVRIRAAIDKFVEQARLFFSKSEDCYIRLIVDVCQIGSGDRTGRVAEGLLASGARFPLEIPVGPRGEADFGDCGQTSVRVFASLCDAMKHYSSIVIGVFDNRVQLTTDYLVIGGDNFSPVTIPYTADEHKLRSDSSCILVTFVDPSNCETLEKIFPFSYLHPIEGLNLLDFGFFDRFYTIDYLESVSKYLCSDEYREELGRLRDGFPWSQNEGFGVGHDPSGPTEVSVGSSVAFSGTKSPWDQVGH